MQHDLDIEQPDQLLAYLRGAGAIGPDEPIRSRTLAGGVSNRTVLVERPGGEAWVLKQALAKLRVAVDWFSSPERIHREALGLRWLAELAPPATTARLVFEDHRHHILAMEAVPQPHANWKTLLLAGQLEPGQIAQFAALLGAIHAGGFARRAEVEPVFADQHFFETLRVEPYYTYTAGQIPRAAPFFDALVAGTRARRITLVHGDYSPKNVLVREGRLVLLDHEVIHFGDPAFDLGFALTHLLSKAHHLPALRERFAAAARQFWDEYAAAVVPCGWSGLEAQACRHTLGCLLARVAGRSPLEYLGPAERRRQRAAALRLIDRPPARVAELAGAFLDAIVELEASEENNADPQIPDGHGDPGQPRAPDRPGRL